MASGKFSKAFTQYDYEVIVEWSSEADTASNSSVITADISLHCVYTLRTSQHEGSKITINNVEYPFTSPTINADGETVHLATITSNPIAHDSDGNKSVNIVCDYAVNATISGTFYGIITASDTVDLDLIPRQATLTSAENFNDDENPSISYSNPAGNAVGALQAAIYSNDGKTAYAAYRNITKTATSYTFNLTTAERNALRNAIPEAKSMKVRFYLKTTISGTSYYSYITKTLTIVDANPTISPTIKDTNSTTLALTGNENTIVRFYSNAAITIGASAIKGATLKSQKASNSGKSFTTASGTLNAVESAVFLFTATDSRGNTTNTSVEKPFIDYVKLTANFKPQITVDGVISFTVSGNYFNGSFGAVSNELNAYYRYKAEDGDFGDWVELSTNAYSTTYESSVSFTIPNFNYKNTYTFQIKANDKLMSLAEREYVITALPVFDWSKEDFNFNVPVSIEGYPLADFVIEDDYNGNWHYRKWYSGRLEAWNNLSQSDDEITYQAHTNSGGIYRWIGRVSLPSGLFSSVEYSVVNGTLGVGWWNGSQSTTALTTDTAEIIFFTVATIYNDTKFPTDLPLVYIVGKWKE